MTSSSLRTAQVKSTPALTELKLKAAACARDEKPSPPSPRATNKPAASNTTALRDRPLQDHAQPVTTPSYKRGWGSHETRDNIACFSDKWLSSPVKVPTPRRNQP